MAAGWDLPTLADTQNFAAALTRVLRPGDVVRLKGSVGAGKTTLVQCMARSWGLPEGLARSPTFSLMNVYELEDFDVVHSDLYRIEGPEEVAQLGLLECLGADDCLCLVEWPDPLGPWMPSEAPLWVQLLLQKDQRRALVSSALELRLRTKV